PNIPVGSREDKMKDGGLKESNPINIGSNRQVYEGISIPTGHVPSGMRDVTRVTGNAERYWSFEKKWYFFTPRRRMTPNEDRPNKRTRIFGYWKMSQKVTMVYMCDDASGLEVGNKRCLVYCDASNKKSQWLMHEYTTIDPNIPVGSKEDKLKVLCEIYKKETDDSEQQVFSARNQQLDKLSHRKRILMHHQGSSYQMSASTLVFQQQVNSMYQDNQSIESNEDNFSINDEVLLEQLLDDDYTDSLKPGYRFCPTDSEMIVYYLQPKIKTGEQHPRCQYYIANFYGDTLDNLAANHRHFENKWYFLTPRDRKYPNGNRPNKRIKNFGFQNATNDKLIDWVLAKIYKKEGNPNDNSNGAYQVENMMNLEELMEDQN
nr:NAC domain-containing protein [Tanacetum cinerariifolium]